MTEIRVPTLCRSLTPLDQLESGGLISAPMTCSSPEVMFTMKTLSQLCTALRIADLGRLSSQVASDRPEQYLRDILELASDQRTENRKERLIKQAVCVKIVLASSANTHAPSSPCWLSAGASTLSGLSHTVSGRDHDRVSLDYLSGFLARAAS